MTKPIAITNAEFKTGIKRAFMLARYLTLDSSTVEDDSGDIFPIGNPLAVQCEGNYVVSCREYYTGRRIAYVTLANRAS